MHWTWHTHSTHGHSCSECMWTDSHGNSFESEGATSFSGTTTATLGPDVMLPWVILILIWGSQIVQQHFLRERERERERSVKCVSEMILDQLNLMKDGSDAARHRRYNPNPVCRAATSSLSFWLHVGDKALCGRMVVHNGEPSFLCVCVCVCVYVCVCRDEAITCTLELLWCWLRANNLSHNNSWFQELPNYTHTLMGRDIPS